MTTTNATTATPPARTSRASRAAGYRFSRAAGYRFRWPPLTRRGIQITLGAAWLLDAVLQLQPFMFTTGFAHQILAGAAAGQPGWVAGPTIFFAHLVAAHPVPLDAGFALTQFALGIGFLFPSLARAAILGSLAWSGGIWWFGEGLGALASGKASLVTGAPGAVLLYAVLALAAWPTHRTPKPTRPAKTPTPTTHAKTPKTGRAVWSGAPRWFPFAWAILWAGGAAAQLVGGAASAAMLRDQIATTTNLPSWLAAAHHLAQAVIPPRGGASLYVLVAVMALIGLAGLGSPPWRITASVAGAIAATAFWVLGQNIGQLYSGMATDPNTGPLIVVMALALASTSTPAAGNNPARHPPLHPNTATTPIHQPTGNELPPTAIPPTTVPAHQRIGNDVNISKRLLALMITAPLVLTGCAAAYATAHTPPNTPTMTMAPGQTMTPGQTMAPGQSMAAPNTTHPNPTAVSAHAVSAVGAGVPASAAMVCGPETAHNVATLMGLHTPPPSTATWVGHLFTCTYALPGGPLVLSVKESPDIAAARAYFNARRHTLGPAQPLTGLAGLGLPAYQNTTGSVLFLKDNTTLQVNATTAPAHLGPGHTSRSDLAYTLATDVLACWTGK